jgi:MinD-like ATPase involved in chromosome partitioning or flagellar assembly
MATLMDAASTLIERKPKIITFYSYKGGTGRSMALANVAWILAASGSRVLTIDWDLEAPGLHRYFRPFLSDPDLTNKKGLIDLLWDYSHLVLSPKENWPAEVSDPKLFADPRRYIIPLEWNFGESAGCVHLLPAGLQDEGYGSRVRDFDWRAFYERLGGAEYIDSFRTRLNYDFVLIDSRTGVADTSGICTLHLPDKVVLCFTYNRQSIKGVEAVASSILLNSRRKIKITLIATRVEKGIKGIDKARSFARECLDRFLPREWSSEELETYWSNCEISYYPEYAFEETISLFREVGTQRTGPLADMSWVATSVAGPEAVKPVRIPTDVRERYMRRLAFRDPRLAELDELLKEWTPSSGDARIRELLAEALRRGESDASYVKALANAALEVASQMREAGQLETAQELTERTIELQENHLPNGSDDAAADLVTSLNRLGALLSEQRRPDEAVKIAQRAIVIQEQLYNSDQHRFGAGFASSLSILSGRLMDVDNLDEAVAVSRQAMSIFEALSKEQPNAYVPDQAALLYRTAEIMILARRPSEALPALEKATAIYRELSLQRPEAFALDLAACLTALAKALRILERFEPGLAAAEEAVAIYQHAPQRLQEANAARAEMANIFLARGHMLLANSQNQEAVESLTSAAQLFRMIGQKKGAEEVELVIAKNWRGSDAKSEKSDRRTCFVLMGYGEKTDFQSNPQRVLNLNRTYEDIIKPVVTEAGYVCIRADEIIHSTVIDKPMYDNLLSADLVIADLSTSNPNAIYELGVRHALRPERTIVMAENNFSFAFDVNHLSILKYEHLGKDIGFSEVMRVRKILKDKITTPMGSAEVDSPVFLFIPSLQPPILLKPAMEAALAPAPSSAPIDQNSLAELLVSFRAAKSQVTAARDWAVPLDLLNRLNTMRPDDPYILQQLALATYKFEQPDKKAALIKAQGILSKLGPQDSSDAETIGLWAAIHKQLWYIRENRQDLEEAIGAHERGFYLTNDYYNGINFAFLLDLRATLESGEEAITDRVVAQRVRRLVLALCDRLLDSGSFLAADKFWIEATRAEALIGIGRKAEAEALKQAVFLQTQEPWQKQAWTQQMIALERLLPPGGVH